MIVREQIYQALFDKVSAAAGFVTKSRKILTWDDVTASQCPAVFQVQRGESVDTQGVGLPYVSRLAVDIVIYADAGGNPLTTPSVQINELVDAIFAATAPSPVTKVQQLGLPKMVKHCWIEGQIACDEGTLGSRGVAIIPFVILCSA